MTFDELVDILVKHRDYTKGCEREIERLKRERDDWHECADPGWKDRELRADLDGEIRLMHQ